MVEKLIKASMRKAKANPKTIVFPEAEDPRILKAVKIICKEKIAHPVLIGNKKKLTQLLKKQKINPKAVKIINPDTYEGIPKFCLHMYQTRKHKGLSFKDCKTMMKDPNYFATMLVKQGKVDGMVSGVASTTAEVLRPALQIIKTKEKFHKVSAVFFMSLKNQLFLFADAGVNINPDAKDLAEIAIDTAETAKKFGITPRIAMLSFSTHGSAVHPLVDKIKEATKIIKYKRPKLEVDGEIQVDAALVKEVYEHKTKVKYPFKKQANIFIFPDLQSANISYKLVERLGKAKAIGPILQGLNAPINDLSRGCSVEDIVYVTAFTVIEAQEQEKEKKRKK